MSWQPLDVNTFETAPLSLREELLSKPRTIREPISRAPRAAVPAYRFCILLQELRLAGWKRSQLASLTTLTAPALRLIETGTTKWVHPGTAECLERLWDLLPVVA